jgi:hypothetical protein
MSFQMTILSCAVKAEAKVRSQSRANVRIGRDCLGREGLPCFAHDRWPDFASRAAAGGFVGADARGGGEGRRECAGGAGAAVRQP